MPAEPLRLAFVGADRQLHVVDHPPGPARQVTWSLVVGGLVGWAGAASPDGRLWPCWSPDGRWLCCFRLLPEEDRVGAGVLVVEVDGIEERELFELSGEVPIYAQWSPDGQRIAVLSQKEDELQLRVIGIDGAGLRLVDQGVPIFFCWTRDSQGLLVHSGGAAAGGLPRRPGRLVRRAIGGQGEDVVFPTGPGSFCAPLPIPGTAPAPGEGGRVAFVTAAPGPSSHVVTAAEDGERPRHVATLRGLLAVLPDFEGRLLALGSSPGGESSPYDGIWVAPVEGGTLTQVSTHPAMAFFWCPGGRRLVFASLDREAGCARWFRLDLDLDDPTESQETELASFWPSRDQLFLLHFFEQYAQSHPPVDPSGRWLVYASHPDPEAREPDGRAQILMLDLDAPQPDPVVVAQGSFAVFAPGSEAPAG